LLTLLEEVRTVKKIAVTTDFTEASRLPFGAAVTVSEKFHTGLCLVNVVRSPQIFTPWQIPLCPPSDLRERRAESLKRLQALATEDRMLQRARVEPVVLFGESAEALSDYQQKEQIDLIVIATHGYSGIKLFPLGSFTSQVLQLTACSVLVFRAGNREVRDEPPFHPRRLLVPYDFSPASNRSLESAFSWARVFDASVTLLSVVDPKQLVQHATFVTEGDLTQAMEKAQSRTKELLERLIAEESMRIRAEAHVRAGHPALEILREASEHPPDLIVMATRGHSLSERLNLGSVAERTIHGADCPVLVVK
jgi:nucleotide-binding universal stress UspA family protein